MKGLTDLDFYVSATKKQVLDWLCYRCSGTRKFQNVIITEGPEGYGKSTLTAMDAYYMAYKLRRPLRLFFDVEALSEHAIKHNDEILIWDDVAFAGLSLEAYNVQIIELIKVLMLARKKRNTFFLNIQELFRMKEPLVARAIGMNRVYSPDGFTLGNYCYYNQLQVNWMYQNWIRRKRKIYKYYSFLSTFPDGLYKVFDEKQYESFKDKAILSIKSTSKAVSRSNNELDKLRNYVARLPIDNKTFEKHFGKSARTRIRWRSELINANSGGDAKDEDSEDAITKNNASYIEPKDTSYLKLPKEKISLPISKSKLQQKINTY